MTMIDQNSMILSQEQNLSPKPCLLDSRTEKDLLCFLTEFASLINFYDTDNTQQGSWKPFLLKDPVFLLAHISKVSFLNFYTPYASAKTQLAAIFSSAGTGDDLSFYFNQIFSSISDVFYTLERWSFFMKRSDEQYEMKDYMLHRIRSDFSGFLWAINNLRDALSASSLMGKSIEPVNYFVYDTWDDELWKQSRDKNPYWEVLGLDKPLQDNKKTGYEALIKACDRVFDFFKGLIVHAHDAYEELKNRKSKYPDTTLLRTGVHLLSVHQQQLNGIAQKHLHFYYHDILKQQVQPAVADQVFICAELLKKDSTLLLPAGTLFNAGADAQKNPVYFASSEAVCLNPASLSKVCTLTSLNDEAGFSSLYLQAIEKPDALKQDESGHPLSWSTFGGAPVQPEMQVAQSLIVASPLLLLREGARSIVLTMTFSAATDLRQLKNASYFLSTQSDWSR